MTSLLVFYYWAQVSDSEARLRCILRSLDVIGLWPHMDALRVVVTTRLCGDMAMCVCMIACLHVAMKVQDKDRRCFGTTGL